MTIEAINALPIDALTESLTRCCGAHNWVDAMVALRPFLDKNDLKNKATQTWLNMKKTDILEAFQHHPRIGDIQTLRAKFANTQEWAGNEQSGTNRADEGTLRALKIQNDAYFTKFGYIFIVCATGKSAQEMLDILESRLPNAPEKELKIAANEQLKITHIRLEKL